MKNKVELMLEEWRPIKGWSRNTPHYHGVGKALARKFNVDDSMISYIRRGKYNDK